MTFNRDTLLHVLAVLVLLAAGAWVVHHTEWFEDKVPTPASGEALRDRHYAARQVLRRLGVELVTPPNFDRLPPPSATLVITTWQWNLFPEREQALRRWVEAGGQLVVHRRLKPDWAPVDEARTPPGAAAPEQADACREWREPETVAPAFAERRAFRVCGASRGRALRTAAPVLWSLDTADGPQALRVAVGRGSVTVSHSLATAEQRFLDDDNALLFVASTQAGPGRPVWIIDQEQRSPLLSVIWNAAAPAVLLFAAALALLLWRAGVRFGPRARTAPSARRSVADQIRGTAAFVFQRDAAALHRVQLRALEDAGRRRLRDHHRLDRRARAEAIARATALDADALARAMDPTLTRARRDLVATLALLETAIRRLATDH
jgi:hypothetical protein